MEFWEVKSVLIDDVDTIGGRTYMKSLTAALALSIINKVYL